MARLTGPIDAEAFGEAMGDLILEAVTPLKKQIAELERRLADLEHHTRSQQGRRRAQERREHD